MHISGKKVYTLWIMIHGSDFLTGIDTIRKLFERELCYNLWTWSLGCG